MVLLIAGIFVCCVFPSFDAGVGRRHKAVHNEASPILFTFTATTRPLDLCYCKSLPRYFRTR